MNQYNMTVEDNIFFAKRNIVDLIWKEARLEGIAVTYPDTQTIYDGRTVAGLTLDQTKAINNLKHAWAFVLDNIEMDVDIRFARQINNILGGDNLIRHAGELRQTSVKIGGTSWVPDRPEYDDINEKLNGLREIDDPIDRAIEMFLTVAKGQWFEDGNKRTAQLLANTVLISNGCGLFAIPVDRISEFYGLLIEYYETSNVREIKQFIYECALDGIDYSI